MDAVLSRKRRVRTAGSAVCALAMIASFGCVSTRAYEEVQFALRHEEQRRREAEESHRQLLRKLKDMETTSAAELNRLRLLEDENVQLQKTAGELREESLRRFDQTGERERQLVVLFKEDLREELKLQINPESGGLVLEHDVLFEPADLKLKDMGGRLLVLLAEALNLPRYRDRVVYIDGHTDARPVTYNRELNPDNWILGARRAGLVREALARAGVDGRRLVIRSMGESRPMFKEDPKDPRNRRVEIGLGERVGP
ncbi:MAG TPA: OmpA family protein [Planctomycetota bacterium]|jgi:flagellar motor protein MotB|nr:OmpA family protein [Planctomycetota bacterium]OQC22312.1 MAG: flagellar motor protein MotD [Planctomycetes bacterium ADurb.Bin069]HNS00616.1 OmpA family protein [Planctomycetota bacterium]HNU26731.1 OmpA family protein [Planctomycetota bacterium]HOE29237.1 OmpA family protein [Planctomycetota bacterium]